MCTNRAEIFDAGKGQMSPWGGGHHVGGQPMDERGSPLFDNSGDTCHLSCSQGPMGHLKPEWFQIWILQICKA